MTDYSATASEEPTSQLYVDGVLVPADHEWEVTARLFAGVHPILMQHNLRKFVHDDPTSRRQYFERLLQVDELTALIEKAVVGPAALSRFGNPDGGAGLAALRALVSEFEKDVTLKAHVQPLKKVERAEPGKVAAALEAALVDAAPILGLVGGSLPEYKNAAAVAQQQLREKRLPLLAKLSEASTRTPPTTGHLEAELASLRDAIQNLRSTEVKAAALSSAQQELAGIMVTLVSKALVRPDQSSQPCPICADSGDTLTKERIAEILSWAPLSQSLLDAKKGVQRAREGATRAIAQIADGVSAVTPGLPSDGELLKQLKGLTPDLADLTMAAVGAGKRVRSISGAATEALTALSEGLDLATTTRDMTPLDTANAVSALSGLASESQQFHECLTRLEQGVGAASGDDRNYRLRERWLGVVDQVPSVVADVSWERSKQSAKELLDRIRNGLIELRTQIIENARQTFSAEMTSIWHLLRSDSGAQFSKIEVPPPSGRGYKLEFELKATISDGSTSPEVDALRVFSESQVNVIGIAAYVTRARLLGHKVLIFDDPVQSMDEEHFRSFAANLLPMILDSGLQVLILTHSETFARRLNDQHYFRTSYVTLQATANVKNGCEIGDGNRRITERLSNARRAAKEGDLPSAWRFIRLAIERAYTLGFARRNPTFDPETWKNLTADAMWNQGAGAVIEAAKPGSGRRLKEILTMTVAGAHDAAAGSETDVNEASKFLGTLLGPLQLGGG